MSAVRIYAWGIVIATAATTLLLFLPFDRPFPAAEILFWVVLLGIAELLPVTIGFQTQITMGFPIFMASAILFEPPLAMTIVGVGAFDSREFKRELPLHHALFNRTQVMLAVGLASSIIHVSPGSLNIVLLLAAAVAHLVVNLGLVAGAVHYEQRLPFAQVLRDIPPKPLAGFALTYLMLTSLGAATAIAYERVGAGGEWVVIAILVPLLLARMTIQGAKAQEELSAKIQRQQEALLTATETVFQERELERARIAEHIHDSSLQMLAAAAYGCSNTAALLDAGKTERAKQTLSSADEAIHTAIAALRESLVDLRRASVEEGGLMTTVTKFVDQLSVLWAAKIEVVGEISHEPPIPVALAAFQILQEGVVNALKHSNGDQIVVRITEDESHMVHLVVEDEGPGFDPAQHVESDHVGMMLMKERAEGVGGEIKLHSAPGSGTRLEAILPAGMKVA